MSFKGGKKSNVHKSQEGYDLYAENYDKTLGFLDSFEKDELKKMIIKTGGKKVLDLGCGTGRLFPFLVESGKNLTGLDISSKMIEKARKKYPKIESIIGDSENLPFKDNSFDIVISAFVVVHLKNIEKTFSEVYRVLKNGGAFIVTNINQKKAPKLKLDTKNKIVIKSFYHMPKEVKTALENNLFIIEEEKIIYDGEVWINQIIRARK